MTNSSSQYTFGTPEASYVLDANPLNPDNVFIRASHKADLETVIDSLEIAGVADGRYFEDLEIEISSENEEEESYSYFLEISRTDLALFLQFEVLNYLGVVVE